MNAIQIKEILRRERDSDNLVFVRDKSPEFYFQGGRLKFPLFEWPTSKGFTIIIWFRNNFQLSLKGQDTYQLAVSQNFLSFNGSSYTLNNLKEWNFFSLTHSPQSIRIYINGVIIPKVAALYPQTRQWEDCTLGTTVSVGDFVIFKDVLKEDELCQIATDMGFKGIDVFNSK